MPCNILPIDKRGKRIIIRASMNDEPVKALLLAAVGARTRALRLEAGLTVKEFARRAALSPRFVNQLEAGAGNISIAGLARVAAALGRSTHELIPPVGNDHSLPAEIWRLLSDDTDLFVGSAPLTDGLFEVCEGFDIEDGTNCRDEEMVKQDRLVNAERLEKRFVEKRSWTHSRRPPRQSLPQRSSIKHSDIDAGGSADILYDVLRGLVIHLPVPIPIICVRKLVEKTSWTRASAS